MPPSPGVPEQVGTPTVKPTLPIAIGRGLLCRCPGCGKSRLFEGYLRVKSVCQHCHAPLGLARADDAPPYFTIMVTGHLVVPLLMYVDRAYALSSFAMSAIFLPLSLVMAVALLRPIKGGTVGAMLTLGMMKTDAEAR